MAHPGLKKKRKKALGSLCGDEVRLELGDFFLDLGHGSVGGRGRQRLGVGDHVGLEHRDLLVVPIGDQVRVKDRLRDVGRRSLSGRERGVHEERDGRARGATATGRGGSACGAFLR